MPRRLKLLAGLSSLALTGAFALGGCAGEGDGEGANGEGATPAASHAEGEGEGAASQSEGEDGATSGDPTTDDVAYMTKLLLVRGHLKAFRELHRIGAHEFAGAHVKHPESELYSALVPAFAARKNTGFAEALATLANANEENGDVDGAYEAAKAAIRSVEPAYSTKGRLIAAAQVARIAAEEFDVAAEDDGSIGNVKEYQDAYGFLSVSNEMLKAASPANADERAALDAATAQLDSVLARFDGWTPKSTMMKPSEIYSAAARIEISGLGLS